MKKRKSVLVISVAMLCIGIAAFMAIRFLYSNKKVEQAHDEHTRIREVAIQSSEDDSRFLSIDHDALLSINPKYIGWIDIPGTVISYPIIWNDNNDDYIKMTFEGNKNQSGVIFIDSRSDKSLDDANTVIHGHHIKNGTMFAELRHYVEPEFLAAHPEIHIYTPSGIYVYRVILAEKSHTLSPAFTFTFNNDLQRDTWLSELSVASGVELNKESKVITLSTCTKENDAGRYIVQAVFKEKV